MKLRCKLCEKILNKDNIGYAVNKDGEVLAYCKECQQKLNIHRRTRKRKRRELWVRNAW